MIEFEQKEVAMFLGVVRKYMQIRGGLSQKDLAEAIDVGISTMSRFLNQKTKDLDEQLIAKIVAHLQIPLHEIIDFVEEDSTMKFKQLVSFYKQSDSADKVEDTKPNEDENEMSSFEEGLNTTRQKTSASIKGVKVPFGENTSSSEGLSIRDKLNNLSPRQKGFLTDFLDLDVEGRDLIVDIGNSLFRFFKQKNAEF